MEIGGKYEICAFSLQKLILTNVMHALGSPRTRDIDPPPLDRDVLYTDV